ncbi:sodium/hydrogen exchanger 9B2-like [Pollicipes pollicipes]|uniref:sodium/hydrogen exchanger 9B2-like n=1 Tax=Pollicipes pollicipes TaxID=41117 RepID=UPI00188573ED|nr:sodium/hydrogen exchanger 9B2-like [Pollicipes pollicipes]XP_037084503.1 sodium/hydrogen exchanger 9B2-like [Pollicipes pollicipes]XP_037084504.1 sodium/hydrogen exchanger 9B2-like [Pollicipes pollicipes]
MADPTATYVFPALDLEPPMQQQQQQQPRSAEQSTSSEEKQSRSSEHGSLNGTDLATRGSGSKPPTISDDIGDQDVFLAEPLELQSPEPTGRCHRCSRPLLRSTYKPLPAAPVWRRLLYGCTCPPWGRLEQLLVAVLVTLALWALAVSLADKEALPGGQIFGVLCVVVLSLAAGWLVERLRLPPLLGMLIMGIVLANVPGLSGVATAVKESTSSLLRNVALMVILTRAGLGLDAGALRRLSLVVVRLAFTPCLSETLTVGIAAHLLLGMPWIWSFMLGFVLAAVSPAVVVPCLLALQEQGYGVAKGVPTLVMAAASIDDVLAISGFGVLFGICFSQGALTDKLLSGPLEVLLGLSYGVSLGVLLWFLPGADNRQLPLLRLVLITCLGLLALFGSQAVGCSGAGALGALTLSFVAGHGWRQRGWTGDTNPVSEAYGILWFVFQPILFGLIGAEIRVDALKADTVGFGLLTLAIGLTVRIIVSFFVVMGGGLTVKERLFVAVAWLPKATVQAAIGPVALDYARLHAPTPENIALGEQVVAIAVLVILVTAPIGAAAIMLSAPRLLVRGSQVAPGSQDQTKGKVANGDNTA